VLAEHLGCEATEEAVHARRLATDPEAYAASLLRATNTERVLVDTGYPPPEIGTSWEELGALAGCPAQPILRIESVSPPEAVGDAVAGARAAGFVALKTIAAYRGGLAEPAPEVVRALEDNAATGDPLPVQVHTGFGDADLSLPLSRPGLLKPLIERFDTTPFVLLHCYPFVREAGWLAHVYPNVWFDLSLTIPHVARPVTALLEALELAPFSKLLYASDAARTPELYLLGATWWREALAEALALLGEGEEAARAILRQNALRLYPVTI